MEESSGEEVCVGSGIAFRGEVEECAEVHFPFSLRDVVEELACEQRAWDVRDAALHLLSERGTNVIGRVEWWVHA